MHVRANRLPENPILRPGDVSPSRPDLEVACLLNPGACRFGDQTLLLLRVAERPVSEPGWVSTVVCDPDAEGGLRIIRIRKDDPELNFTDPRVFEYRGQAYLTTLSHLRLARSSDGVHFSVDPTPTIIGSTRLETYGVEDCRINEVEGEYLLTYTAVSDLGVGVGMQRTRDWRTFRHEGMIIPPHNKDCALFPERVNGQFVALHRPSGLGIGGNYIWLSRSPDLLHWGEHECLLTTRPGLWDADRVGAGAAPIRTEQGWLIIYHGADHQNRYCLGGALLDLSQPQRVIARSTDPIMTPSTDYETCGFFGNVVFTNGHVIDGDRVRVYYGAADEVICAADFSVAEIVDSLTRI